jgi:hypothetical protein
LLRRWWSYAVRGDEQGVSDNTWEDFRRQEAGEPPRPIAYTAEDLAEMTPEEVEDLLRYSR